MLYDWIFGSTSPGWATALFVGGEYVLRVIIVLILLGRRHISSDLRITWIILVLAFPIIGWVLYLLIGRTQIGGRRVSHHKDVQERVAALACHPSRDPELSATLELTRSQRQIALVAERVSGGVPLHGNTAELFGDSAQIVERIVADIDGSVDHCHLLFFIWLDDASGTAVGEALMRAKARGVETRVLVDAIGSKAFLRSPLRSRMDDAGVHVAAALQVNALRAVFHRLDLRNHRKIVIIDGSIAWTGSQNMAEASFAPKPKFAPWVDCAVRLVGPAAKDLQLLFAEDWYFDTGEFLEDEIRRPCIADARGVITQVIASGPNCQTHVVSELIQGCIQIAEEAIVFTTPYFVPDQSTIMNLCVAARRGVEVDLVLPKRNDSLLVALASRSSYQGLLDAGVRIHEFVGGLLHAKTITIDRSVAVVMSANLDRRSFNLNFEAGVLIHDDDFASELRFLQQGYIDRSTTIDYTAWMARGLSARMCENAAGLFSPLL